MEFESMFTLFVRMLSMSIFYAPLDIIFMVPVVQVVYNILIMYDAEMMCTNKQGKHQWGCKPNRFDLLENLG